MCWSEDVSLASWLYDTACLAVLAIRKRSNDEKYVIILWGIMSQELFQFIAWRLIDRAPGECTFALACASVGAMLSSQAIPVGMVAAGAMGANDGKSSHGHRLVALGCWAAQFALVVYCAFRSGTRCMLVGANGHQSWICAQSLYAVGGYALYVVSFGLYVVAVLFGFRTLDLPKHEISALKRIGGLSAGLVYARYTSTLEACSIWCWSAAALASYAVLRR